MSEPSTVTYKCEDCGTPFERKRQRGKQSKYCKSCAFLRQRGFTGRPYETGVGGSGYTTVHCEECGSPFHFPPRATRRGSVPKRCIECNAARKHVQRAAARARARAAKADARPKPPAGSARILPQRTNSGTGYVRKFPDGVRVHACAGCDGRIEQAAASLPKKFCRDCKLKNRRATHRALRAAQPPAPKPPIVCAICAIEVAVPERGAGALRYCPPCKRDRVREINRHAGHKRRVMLRGGVVEKFTHEEIYERDRWICGLCKKKINRRLRYPHPMSVQLDHIIPVTKGGNHVRTNVMASHKTCNNKKYNRGGGEQLMLIG